MTEPKRQLTPLSAGRACDADFDGDINWVTDPLSALQQLIHLKDAYAKDGCFKLIWNDSGDTVETRRTAPGLTLKYSQKANPKDFTRRASLEEASELLHLFRSPAYEPCQFLDSFTTLHIPQAKTQEVSANDIHGTLLPCPDCGRQLSRLATTCHSAGAP